MATRRLVFLPETGSWHLERLEERQIIEDRVELTPEGVARRFGRDQVLAALRRAVEELEREGA